MTQDDIHRYQKESNERALAPVKKEIKREAA